MSNKTDDQTGPPAGSRLKKLVKGILGNSKPITNGQIVETPSTNSRPAAVESQPSTPTAPKPSRSRRSRGRGRGRGKNKQDPQQRDRDQSRERSNGRAEREPARADDEQRKSRPSRRRRSEGRANERHEREISGQKPESGNQTRKQPRAESSGIASQERQLDPRMRGGLRPETHETRIENQQNLTPSESTARDSSFGDMNLLKDTVTAIHSMGYDTPTGIQEQAIPYLLDGRDVVGQAQTGSGKTASFGIPIVERITPGGGAIQAIVLVPTRELATQVADEIASIGRTRGIAVVPVYGGQPINRQLRLLDNRPEVLVGTPGRVMDHISRGTVALNNVRVAVLDEADRMLDIGFADDMEWILSRTPRSRQMALFSATVPGFVRKLIRRYMDDPEWIRIGLEIQTVDEVDQYYSEIAARDKPEGVREILDEIPDEGDPQVLIFCEMQVGVDRLVRILKRDGYPIEGLHGGMSQRDRDSAMRQFREGSLSILVSTNLAARGIDIPSITHVINYEMPENVEEYVHRIGRTARMGRKGTAISLIGEWDVELLEKVKKNVGADRLKVRPTHLYQ
jgi:superfamily II DNA/RNA helicase